MQLLTAGMLEWEKKKKQCKNEGRKEGRKNERKNDEMKACQNQEINSWSSEKVNA